jgi:CO/xanthine dehydrogenase FAD-binding subunit
MLAGVTRRDANGKFDHVALSMGSVAPFTLRLGEVEATLLGRKPTPKVLDAAEVALDAAIAPIDDIRSNAAYRRFAARGLLRQCLTDGEHTALSDLPAPF